MSPRAYSRINLSPIAVQGITFFFTILVSFHGFDKDSASIGITYTDCKPLDSDFGLQLLSLSPRAHSRTHPSIGLSKINRFLQFKCRFMFFRGC